MTPERSDGALDGSGREWSPPHHGTAAPLGLLAALLPRPGGTTGRRRRVRQYGELGPVGVGGSVLWPVVGGWWPTGLSCGPYLPGGCPVRWQKKQVGMGIRCKDSLTTRGRP